MKKMSLLQILSFMAIAILVASCSSQAPEQVIEKTYSPGTLKEFEAIEKNETYSAQSENTTLKQNNRASKTPLNLKQKETAKEIPPRSPIGITSDVSQLSAKNQERLQEINQNLAFFCMKHRKSTSFKSEEQCLVFTKKIQVFCEKKHKLINKVMLNCIKAKLKKIK